MTVDSKTQQTDRVSINTFSNEGVDPASIVKSGSKIDGLIWLVCIVLLVAATLVNRYLPQYVASASSVWVRIAVITGLVVVALFGLYKTHQGKGFMRLLVDARMELHRITWPTKQDTVKTSWVVMVVVLLMSILLWALDNFFGWIVKLIVG